MALQKKNRFKAGQRKQQIRDALGSDQVEYELEDGTVLTFPWVLDYTREQKAALKLITGDDEDDEMEFVRVILGEEQAELFEAAGGDPDDLALVVADAAQKVQDVQAGHKLPTR